MKAILKILSSVILTMFFLAGCEEEPIDPDNDAYVVKAIGTYRDCPDNNDCHDKDKWGDFQLVLAMEKFKYTLDEPISIKLYFSNIGEKTIYLDGILPYRQSANPPTIDIWAKNGKVFRIEKILDNLLNENDIYVGPDRHISLMQFDLMNTEGVLLVPDSLCSDCLRRMEFTNISSEIVPDTYYIRAFFHPTPQIYGSITDTLTFVIE